MAEQTIIEAPMVLTLKCNDSRDSPWLVLRATDAQQLQSQLQELENSSLFADIGRVAGWFQAQAVLGAQLGAKGVDPVVDGGSFNGVQSATPVANAAPAAAPPAAPKAGGFPAFKVPAATAAPVAPSAAAPTSRPASESPAAAPAANGFPQAPQWKKP